MKQIVLDNISIGYRHKTIAAHLTATISSGDFTCLIGRNGLGKSTLLRTIAGFQSPLSGSIKLDIDGRSTDLASLSKPSLSRLISVVLTERLDIYNMTASEVVAMGRMPYTNYFGTLRKEDKQIVADALAATGTTALAQRDIATLSDGERQKIMIARAIAQQTPVMLLDEPTAFLDYPSKVETMKLLHNLAHDMDKVVLASTHDLDIANRYADKMLTIDNGIKPANLKQYSEYLQ